MTTIGIIFHAHPIIIDRLGGHESQIHMLSCWLDFYRYSVYSCGFIIHCHSRKPLYSHMNWGHLLSKIKYMDHNNITTNVRHELYIWVLEIHTRSTALASYNVSQYMSVIINVSTFVTVYQCPKGPKSQTIVKNPKQHEIECSVEGPSRFCSKFLKSNYSIVEIVPLIERRHHERPNN